MESDNSAGGKCSLYRLNQGIASGEIIVVLGNCMTFYEGRGAAHSGYGDKIIVVKSDGSVIVHGPTGFKPLNWQPDTVHLEFKEDNGDVVLRAVRGKPRETLIVRCRELYECISRKARADGGFYMYFSEHEIRDLIRSDPSLIEKNLKIVEAEKPVEPGFVDLYGIDGEGRTVVIEIKRVKAGEDAARQLYGYVEKLRRSIPNIRGILVAPDFTESALRMLQRSGLEYKRIDLKALYSRYSSRMKNLQSLRRHRSLEDFL